MLNDLAMALQVMIRPNQTFATLRDNDRQYFLPSIALMLLLSAVYAGLDSAAPPIAGQQATNAAASFGLTIIGIVASAGTLYIIGKALGGNRNWRKVFTVIFYAEVVGIPMVAASVLLSLLPLSLQGAAFVMMIAVLIWAVIIGVKAVKVLNGFGTAKAFGILILSGLIQLIWLIPISLLYLWPFLLESPII